MEIGFDYGASMMAALTGARSAEAAAARSARRAEDAFEDALASGGADVQAAAERFRTAHRAYVEARTEVAEIEAALEERGVFSEELDGNRAAEELAA